ncbi:uncharacterized protein BDR25DRAFT_265836 [Lindgomyces ingoldianus]|uniref:Uncharacterized protein n=1 Tax=Lindgomyces ingoldianus TaxID=673940 RepID=A0ACB6QMP6_9PLEO|nr:uncharacterized protein BDR25DRAFT_265836 [Lindgomyces ingoldianus]KAF2468165.1 hypothetical protein BDR25DRAFT_265836 [Lindgomyces ingoldianus]
MSVPEPNAISQPTQSQTYTAPGNPASKSPPESIQTALNSLDGSRKVDQRVPTKQASDDQATASSLGRGIHGAPPGEERKGLTEEDVGRHNELDAEQMGAPGEGRVADAVAGRGTKGVGGEQEDLAADLDRKKAEQQEARDAIKAQRAHGKDVGGAMGQQGGAANPVDKDGYPNTGV